MRFKFLFMRVYCMCVCWCVFYVLLSPVHTVAACKEVTELNAAVDGSVEYPTSGVYAANMRCRWRLHAPVGMVSTSLLSYCIPFP